MFVCVDLVFSERADKLVVGSQRALCDDLDFLANGGRKQKCLPLNFRLVRQVSEDFIELPSEALIQQTIGFVIHDHFEVVEQVGEAGGVFEVVDEPAGGRDQNPGRVLHYSLACGGHTEQCT
jgi:hypothetical protein